MTLCADLWVGVDVIVVGAVESFSINYLTALNLAHPHVYSPCKEERNVELRVSVNGKLFQ